MVDLRKDKRAPASLKVKYKSATVDEFVDQFGTDVSRGGIFVKTKKPIENGALLKLELQLSDASPVIHGIGRVCWRREVGPDASLPPGMGIKFIKLDPGSRAVVERIVQLRKDSPSRFEQVQGAELAPPSMPPPSSSTIPPVDVILSAGTTHTSLPAVQPLVQPQQAPPPKAALPPAVMPARPTAPTRPSMPSARTGLPGGTIRGATPPGAAPPAPPAAAAAAPGAPPPAPPAARPAAPAARTAAPASPRPGDLPPPPANLLRSNPASAPYASRPAGAPTSTGVAGLFANSPMSGAPQEVNPETASRGLFFPSSPSPMNVNNGGSTGSGRIVPPSAPTPSSAPLGASNKPAGRAAQARQSGQFLAAAFVEGGVAEQTATQARAAAERGEDALIDELFAGVEDAALPPSGAPPAAAAPRGEDSFGSIERKNPVSSAPPPLSARPRANTPQPAATRRGSSPNVRSVGSGAQARPNQTDSVDALFAEIAEREARGSSQPAAPITQPPVANDFETSEAPPFDEPDAARNFGEADIFSGVSSSVPPALPLSPLDGGPPQPLQELAQASASRMPWLWIGIGIAAVLAAGAFFLYQRSLATQRSREAHVPSAVVEPAAPAPLPSAAQPEPAGAAQPNPSAQAPAAEAQAQAKPAQPAEDKPTPTVDLEVLSVPRDADVAVDGKHIGSTPRRVALPLARETHVTVSSPGYASTTKTVVAGPNSGSEPLRFTLQPLPYVLIVRSTPPGGEATVGQITALAPAPLELGHLDGGIQVSVGKEGFQRMTRLVRLDEFSERDGVMRAEVEVTLSPLPAGASSSSSTHRAKRAHASDNAPPAPAPAAEPEAASDTAAKAAAAAPEPAAPVEKPAPPAGPIDLKSE